MPNGSADRTMPNSHVGSLVQTEAQRQLQPETPRFLMWVQTFHFSVVKIRVRYTKAATAKWAEATTRHISRPWHFCACVMLLRLGYENPPTHPHKLAGATHCFFLDMRVHQWAIRPGKLIAVLHDGHHVYRRSFKILHFG